MRKGKQMNFHKTSLLDISMFPWAKDAEEGKRLLELVTRDTSMLCAYALECVRTCALGAY